MKSKVRALATLAALAITASAAPALAETFSGEITRVDRGSRSIEVRGGESGRKLRFFLAHGGDVTRDGRAVNFATLKRGERVEVDYARKGATHTARAIAASQPTEAVAASE